MECKFCGNELEILSGIDVCHNCHTVCFSNDISIEGKHSWVLEYLSNIQEKVVAQQAYLHDIEQKHILGSTLTDDEKVIRTNMIEFQDIHLEFNARIENGSHLNDETERKLLYRLLILSEWFTEYFKEEVS